MLCMKRRAGEGFIIETPTGDKIDIVCDLQGRQICLKIDAPLEYDVIRKDAKNSVSRRTKRMKDLAAAIRNHD